MNSNPYVEKLLAEWGGEDDPLGGLDPLTLATLAVAHELGAANAPLRTVVDTGEIFQEDIERFLADRVLAIPDESGEARIAAAARRWANAYGRRNVPGHAAASHLAASELLEAVRQEADR
ncbi:hypothetical protein ACFU1Q_11395 [Brachybacterium paraconglomeratum]